MQKLAREVAINCAGGRSALGLREVQHHETTVLEQNPRVALEPGVTDLQRVIHPDEGAIFKHRIGCGGHGLVVCPNINRPGIAPNIEAHEIRASEQNRLARAANVRHHAGAGETSQAHAILNHRRECHPRLAGHVPAQAPLRSRAIEAAKNPTVPTRCRVRRVAAPWPPPINAFQTGFLVRIAVRKRLESWIAGGRLGVGPHHHTRRP